MSTFRLPPLGGEGWGGGIHPRHVLQLPNGNRVGSSDRGLRHGQVGIRQQVPAHKQHLPILGCQVSDHVGTPHRYATDLLIEPHVLQSVHSREHRPLRKIIRRRKPEGSPLRQRVVVGHVGESLRDSQALIRVSERRVHLRRFDPHRRQPARRGRHQPPVLQRLEVEPAPERVACPRPRGHARVGAKSGRQPIEPRLSRHHRPLVSPNARHAESM